MWVIQRAALGVRLEIRFISPNEIGKYFACVQHSASEENNSRAPVHVFSSSDEGEERQLGYDKDDVS